MLKQGKEDRYSQNHRIYEFRQDNMCQIIAKVKLASQQKEQHILREAIEKVTQSDKNKGGAQTFFEVKIPKISIQITDIQIQQCI